MRRRSSKIDSRTEYERQVLKGAKRIYWRGQDKQAKLSISTWYYQI